MKHLFTFLLLCVWLCTDAAPADSIKIRLYYSSSFKDYEEQENPRYDESVLDISDSIVHFYSRYSTRRQEIIDSVMSIGGTIQDVMNAYEKTGFPTPFQHYQIWKHMPSLHKYTFMDKMGIDMLYEDALGKPDWTLCNGDTLILDYPCKKATTDFCGRTWEVWYTEDIPLPEGPWLLCGLPGIILKATETENKFSFECIQISAPRQVAIKYPRIKKNCMKCKKDDYRQLAILRLEDPSAFEEKVMGKRYGAWDSSGKPLKYPSRKAVFLEKY